MAMSEAERYELHQRLDAVIGDTAANTLMAAIPPVGWADVATKTDIALLKRELDLLEDRLELKFRAELYRALNTAITSQTRTLLFAIVASNFTIGALAFGAALLR